MEVKVIADVVLTVGGITLGVIFVRKVCEAVNYLGHMAGSFMVLTTHTQPGTLKDVLHNRKTFGELLAEDAQRSTAQRYPEVHTGLVESIEEGPDDDYEESVPPGGCMADWKKGEYEKLKALKAKEEAELNTKLDAARELLKNLTPGARIVLEAGRSYLLMCENENGRVAQVKGGTVFEVAEWNPKVPYLKVKTPTQLMRCPGMVPEGKILVVTRDNIPFVLPA